MYHSLVSKMLTIDEAQSFLHAALSDEAGDGLGDVHESPASRHLKPEMFSQ